MKKKLFALFAVLAIFAACQKDDVLQLSQTIFDKVSAEGETLQIDITCSGAWSVTCKQAWCIPDKKSGTGNDVLSIEIRPYIGSVLRVAEVLVHSGTESQTINVSQEGVSENYRYKLPVIFHVLYDNSAAEQQVAQGRVAELIAAVNELYQKKSIDINLEFVLATEAPDGRTLTEPGVERIKVNNATMSYSTFMGSKNNQKYLWDLDKYINIMLYNFTEDGISGVAHMPYIVAPDQLDGLIRLNYIPTLANIPRTHCISINKKFINIKPSVYRQSYNSGDPIGTIAHELGHYLGLHHSFNEANGSINSDTDSDYCTDTPPYNRYKYEAIMQPYLLPHILTWTEIDYLLQRTNSVDGTVTTPNNIMDYDIVYPVNFTVQQCNRVRYVLMHSPLIPGPKLTRANTRTVSGEQEIPVQMAICK